MTIRRSLASTGWPGETRTSLIFPSRGAEREVSIFMTSRVSRRSPALTCSPGFMAIVVTAPGIGAAMCDSFPSSAFRRAGNEAVADRLGTLTISGPG
jgi:hypothetical protein